MVHHDTNCRGHARPDAFILTRPLGAVVGDFLDKPVSAGGLALSRYAASAALLLYAQSAVDRINAIANPQMPKVGAAPRSV